MKEEVFYRKVGKRYKPVSVGFNDNYLSEGVWLVRIGKGIKSITNKDYLEGMINKICGFDIRSIKTLCTIKDYTDFVSNKIFNYLQKESGKSTNGVSYSIQEIIQATIMLVLERNKIEEEEENKKDV